MLGRRGRRIVLATGVAGAVAIMPSIPAAAAVPATASVLNAGSVSARADSVQASQQWVLDMLDVQAAWKLTRGAGVTVAVIDSGVYPNVSDLKGSVVPGHDFTGLNTPSSSSHWGEHGTWMASIIAGHGHDGGVDGTPASRPRRRSCPSG